MKRLIFLLFVFTFIIHAQETIRGIVKNKTHGYPLELANVSIENSPLGISTNSEGYFELSGNFTNEDKLIISYVGYKTSSYNLDNYDFSVTHQFTLEEKILSSQTVLVEALIADKGYSPVTFENIKRSEIESDYTVQDIPEYISNLPSTMFYSESGNGIGYNYLNIRGFDQRRISVSVNGIPQNDPEDHNVYWIDLPDLLESTELIQVQRGAGAGVVGYPSIGGSINIITSPFSGKTEIKLSSMLGSYNTRKYTASFASGLISEKYSIYAKLGQVLSGGYRNGSWSKLNSYHISAVRYDEKLTTQINIYGGPLSDGLAYNGLAKFAVKDKKLRRENLSWWVDDGSQYLYKGVRDSREIENFSQPHYELLNEFKFNENITFNSALFLVLGKGYFDYDGSWGSYSYFRLTPENGFDINKDISESITDDLIIRAMVENKQWGWIPRINFEHANGNLIIGGELRFHNSVHWGAINYGTNLPVGIDKNYKYYYYEGGKDIINFYANENWRISSKFNLLLETQFAYHKYRIENEKYLSNNFEISDFYINPRIGINYKLTPELNIYSAFARVTREPRLKNYYDAAESSGGEVPQFEQYQNGEYNFEKPLVKPETMNNIELGGTIQSEKYNLTLNAFYMSFDNEIVKKGQLDRFGQPITGNMSKTIHAGIEFAGSLRINKDFQIDANVTYSKNYIDEGSIYPDEVMVLDLSDNSISGFPEIMANIVIKYQLEKFFIQATTKYVGEYYSDNYDSKLKEYLTTYPDLTDYSDNKVDAYFVANLFASYELGIINYHNPIRLFIQVNNLFDNLYAAYAVGKEFYPAAERNFLVGIILGL